MFTALSAPVFHLDRQGCAIYIAYTCRGHRYRRRYDKKTLQVWDLSVAGRWSYLLFER
jgi:hypothetical protein